MSTPADQAFELTPSPGSKGPGGRKPRTWYLATNQLNLMFMLAGGLLTGPAGFGRKYFSDALATCPGWLPLFADSIPKRALDDAISEGKHLRPVAVEVDITPLRGEVRVLDRDGTLRPALIQDGLAGDACAVLIPAPLPATWIRSLRFASRGERTAVEDEAKDYANVPLAACKRLVNARLFAGRSACPWPPLAGIPPERDQSCHAVAAVGGAMALTCAFGNRGDAVSAAASLLFDPGCETPQPDACAGSYPLLEALRRWACRSAPTQDQDIQGRMLLACLCELVEAKERAGRESTLVPDFHRTVLDSLSSEGRRLSEGKWRSALERLCGDLESLLGLGDHTVSETLEQHQRPFSRGLILFFLHERTDDLVDFRQPLLMPMDLVVAAALFAARSGWMGLPAGVHELPGLREAVAHRMAALAHRDSGSDLDLGPVPARVRPLREYLGVEPTAWPRQSREAALELTRAMGWRDLVRTRVSLGKGDYRLQVDGRGAHLLLDGEVRAVTTEVDGPALLARLAGVAVPPEVEARVRRAPLREGDR